MAYGGATRFWKGPVMVMNVKPVPTLDDRINDIRMRTAAIVNEHILPNEGRLWAGRRDGSSDDQARKEAHELRTEIKEIVKKAGLWAPHLPQEYGGGGPGLPAPAPNNEGLGPPLGGGPPFGGGAPPSRQQTNPST